VVAVITGSPYKQQLEIKQNKQKQPKLKTKMSQSHDGAGTSKTLKSAKVQRQDDWFCKIREEISMRDMIQCMKGRLWVREDCAKVTSKTKQYQCFDCKFNK
jgi:ribosomal protein L19E